MAMTYVTKVLFLICDLLHWSAISNLFSLCCWCCTYFGLYCIWDMRCIKKVNIQNYYFENTLIFAQFWFSPLLPKYLGYIWDMRGIKKVYIQHCYFEDTLTFAQFWIHNILLFSFDIVEYYYSVLTSLTLNDGFFQARN